MTVENERQRFGEICVKYNFITKAQLEEALRFQETSYNRLGEILIELEILNSTQVAEVLAVQLELPFIQLDRYQTSPNAVKLVPMSIAERLLLVPLEIDDKGALLVTMSDPLNSRAQDEIRRLTGYNLRVAVSGTDDVKINIHRVYNVRRRYITLNNIESQFATGTEGNVFQEWRKFGEMLLNRSLITEAQFEEALRVHRASSKSIVEIFMKFAILNNPSQAVAACLGLSYICLDSYHVSPDVIKLVPQSIAERLNVIPIKIDKDGVLNIAMADPLDFIAQDAIKTLTGYNIRALVAVTYDFKQNISRIYIYSHTDTNTK